jgi:hypothetical protein
VPCILMFGIWKLPFEEQFCLLHCPKMVLSMSGLEFSPTNDFIFAIIVLLGLVVSR